MSIDFETHRRKLRAERLKNGGYWFAAGRDHSRYPTRPVYRWRWL